MTVLKRIAMMVAALTILSGVTELGERLSAQMPSFVSSAQAVVGRPLTPVSVAGVARRTGRRCASGAYNC
jgi:hypothetical protein